MRTFITTALVLAILTGGAYAKDTCPEYRGAEAVIYHKCKKDFPDDFSTQKYCIDSQQESLNELRKRFCSFTKNEEKL